MVIQYFVPLDSLERVYRSFLDYTIIIGVFALLLGIWSLCRVNYDKIKRKSENWQYAIITLTGFFIMTIAGFLSGWGRTDNYLYQHLFSYVLVPIQATMFSLLAFFIASAAFRAFRARSLLATLLLISGLVIMIRFVPLGFLSEPISDLAGWILRVPNMAAKRAIIIGVGLGAVATAFKIMLGIERAYLGRD
jgi:cell shape-determining protein MreD